jgi:predicted hotdog family 3-hydroxylacyl-ACP dehydratase
MFPPIEELVPHAGAMVLLDALTAWRSGYARCVGKVRAGAPFVRDGVVPSVVTIEYMAQAVAACLGYEALVSGGGVRVGMIIGCKRFEAHADALAVNDEFWVDVQCVQGNDSLSHFECRLQRGSECFAEAVLTLFHAPQLPGAERAQA